MYSLLTVEYHASVEPTKRTQTLLPGLAFRHRSSYRRLTVVLA